MSSNTTQDPNAYNSPNFTYEDYSTYQTWITSPQRHTFRPSRERADRFRHWLLHPRDPPLKNNAGDRKTKWQALRDWELGYQDAAVEVGPESLGVGTAEANAVVDPRLRGEDTVESVDGVVSDVKMDGEAGGEVGNAVPTLFNGDARVHEQDGAALVMYRRRTRRRLVLSEEVFAVAAAEHERLAHVGRDKLFRRLREGWYGIAQEECLEVVRRCKACRRRAGMEGTDEGGAGEEGIKVEDAVGLGAEQEREQ